MQIKLLKDQWNNINQSESGKDLPIRLDPATTEARLCIESRWETPDQTSAKQIHLEHFYHAKGGNAAILNANLKLLFVYFQSSGSSDCGMFPQ